MFAEGTCIEMYVFAERLRAAPNGPISIPMFELIQSLYRSKVLIPVFILHIPVFISIKINFDIIFILERNY